MFGGLTGIYAGELTRRGLWEALRARHCYATTGRRINLDVRSGGYMMGDVVDIDREHEISVRIAGTSTLLEVQVLRDDGVVHDQPLEMDPEDEWVRVDWSGLRVRSRNRRADWCGGLSTIGGEIADFVPFGFWRRGDAVDRISGNELSIKSTTSGDRVGVFLRLSGGAKQLRYRSPGLTRKVEVDELGESAMSHDAGGLNLALSFSKSSPNGRSPSADFRFRDETDGEHAYWVRAMQIDGHCAWSSPIYFRSNP